MRATGQGSRFAGLSWGTLTGTRPNLIPDPWRGYRSRAVRCTFGRLTMGRRPEPESTEENRTRAAFAQVSGPIEPFRAFTSQVKIDYHPKDWLTWEDTVFPPWSSVDPG
ncbi:hypothetical protein GCM10027073_38040 [Streptomyces chlorus]